MRKPATFLLSMICSLPLAAQAVGAVAPMTIPLVVQACTPVIDAEYKGDKTQWGVCIAATQSFLTGVVGPPASTDNTDKTVGDLVLELAKLYRDGDVCKANPTELPDAISAAATFIVGTSEASSSAPPDASESAPIDQKALIEQISTTIKDCQTVETGAIETEAVPTVPSALAVSPN